MPAAEHPLDHALQDLRKALTKPGKPRAMGARIVRLMTNVTENMTAPALSDALAEPSDLDALIRLIEQGHTELSDEQVVRLRSARRRRDLLSTEGGAVGPADAADLLGVSRQSIANMRNTHRLIGVQIGREYRYPLWQFNGTAPWPGLDLVLAEMPGDGWSQILLMLGEQPALGGRRGLDALRAGEIDALVDLAQALQNQGTH